MTLTDKTVGTKETFDSDKIRELSSKGIITNIANLEKAIFCLEYVGQLQEARLDFIFKGGSAIQTLLKEKWTRLSVDVGICTNASKDELEQILENIHQKFNKKLSHILQEKELLAITYPFTFTE
jgi:hypothetical protein